MDQRKTDKDIQIDELDYKVYLIKELEKEIESRLSNQFSKEFRVVISADAEILTDSKVSLDEQKEILRIVSAYLKDFDTKQN